MKNTAYVRIPLEERLARLQAGLTSSAQFSRKIVDEFCQTSVIRALESIRAFAERETLCNILRSEPMMKYFGEQPFDSVTLGDLAVIITEFYIRYRDGRTEEGRQMIYDGQQLMSIYFICFDGIIGLKRQLAEEGKPLLRRLVNVQFQTVYDFLNIAFSDYYEYAALCCPSTHMHKIDVFREKRGMSAEMTPLAMYEEMKRNIDSDGDFWFGIQEDDMLSFDEAANLIDFFLYPIALITEKGPAINNT